MARVLIVARNPVMQRLLELRVARLGHEPVVCDLPDAPGEDVDVAIVETADVETLSFARALRRDRPELPILVSSSRARSLETAALEPAAHLMKPYAASRLARALDDTLAPSRPLARAS